MRLRLLWVPLVLLSSVVSADATLIDFESLRHVDTSVTELGPVYSERGFTFTADHPVPGNPHLLRTLGTLRAEFPGSTTLFQGVSQGEIILTRTDGGHFRLHRISFAQLPGFEPGGIVPHDGGPFDVTIEGVKVDGTTVQALVHVDSFLSLRPFVFRDFDHLQAVHWFQGPGGELGPTHQFDDVGVVPEPPPAVLMMAGIVALTGACRRRATRPAR